jgi:hypothetical protein
LSTGRSIRAWRTLCGRQMARNAGQTLAPLVPWLGGPRSRGRSKGPWRSRRRVGRIAGGVCRPPPPVVQERRERAAKARRNGVFALRARPHATGTMHDTPFEHFAVAQRRDKGGTRPAPAISRQKPDNTRHSWEDALHDRRPKPPFRKGPPSLGRGQRGSRILRPRPDLGRGVDASPSFKQQLPLRADLPSRPSPQCPACHPARAAEVSAPRAFKPEVERRQWDDHGSIPAADSARHS